MERKSDTLNLRVTPGFKELIREAAEREHRTIAGFIEGLVRQHCKQFDVAASKIEQRDKWSMHRSAVD